MRIVYLFQVYISFYLFFLSSAFCVSSIDYATLILNKDYSFSYWLNGWRKSITDKTPNILCFETGYYGFSLDVEDFNNSRFTLWDHDFDYTDALSRNVKSYGLMKDSNLEIELEMDGDIYRAVFSEAESVTQIDKLETVRLWESGRLVQHYDLQGLVFKNLKGQRLSCLSDLNILAWPDSLTFSTNVSPEVDYKDGYYPGVSGSALCVSNDNFEIPHHDSVDPAEFTVGFWVNVPESLNHRKGGWLMNKGLHNHEEGYYGIEVTSRGKLNAVMNIGGGVFSVSQIKNTFQDYTEWTYLSLSYDGSHMCFYINGLLQGKTFIDKVRVPNNNPFQLGSRLNGKKRRASALFDDLGIWSRALTSREIIGLADISKGINPQEGFRFLERFDVGDNLVNITPIWSDVKMRINFNGQEVKKHIKGDWGVDRFEELTLNCSFDLPVSDYLNSVSMEFNSDSGNSFPVDYVASSNSYVATIKPEGLSRDWLGGVTDIKDYDTFDIVIYNSTENDLKVPFLLNFFDVANITGICPVLCDEYGIPIGVPIQLSKNWHDNFLGSYLKAYSLLPAGVGKTVYKLRIVYGFYGELPAASHAQLSLIGYGGNGRWDQMSIGCWGETMCLDMDMSLVDVAVTDVRVLMARKGLYGQKWGWTDAGWGGDWLGLWSGKNKLAFAGLKTAYLSHGPCLTDVRYNGFYGSDRDVSLDATVKTLRTDDYARTFYDLNYYFNIFHDIEKGWLFKMGGSHHYVTPKIVYGNRTGWLGEVIVPDSLTSGDLLIDHLELKGEGPWWISFPEADYDKSRALATGYRALVIRSYIANFSGVEYLNPTISLPVFKHMNVDCVLVTPKNVNSVKLGDSVKMELEWITLPRIADDYYGPNEAFRTHLDKHPNSWRTTHKEAVGNDLEVSVKGGVLLDNYPIIIKLKGNGVSVDIKGGVGAVPIQFKGLKSADGYTLYQVIDGKPIVFDQSSFGNDFWQTDFDSKTGTYTQTYNLPLDNLSKSKWVLFYH
jgi:hypothetical protein